MKRDQSVREKIKKAANWICQTPCFLGDDGVLNSGLRALASIRLSLHEHPFIGS